jgi:EAL domain-containing protein (putative c-di-GMP-specific phosphodiesterase class I)
VETGFLPTDLKLEITETVFFEYRQTAIDMLHRLRDMGVELNVDDFGTGYSNLGYLTSLPISSLKIDRSFVAMFDHTGSSPAIVQTIIMLARNLGLRVVAEGVESEQQLEELKKLDCDAAQGYLFARPMELEAICRFLAEEGSVAGTKPALPEILSLPLVQ